MEKQKAEEILKKMCEEYSYWKDKYENRKRLLLNKMKRSDQQNVEVREKLLNIKSDTMTVYGYVQGYEMAIRDYLDEYNKDIPEGSEDMLHLPEGFYFETDEFGLHL